MSATESERLALHKQLAEKIGPEPAGTLMNQLPRVDSDKLATKADLRHLGDRLRVEIQTEMTSLRGEMTELRGEMAELRSEMRDGFAAMEVRLAQQSRELSDKLSSQSRTTTLVVVAMALSVWVAMLVPLLINNSA